MAAGTMLLALAALLALVMTVAAGTDGPAAARRQAAAARELLRRHRTCGSCIAAGGAWCLAADPPGCVPDARGLCGAGGPEAHVGWAGHGRCPDPEDWQLQVYLHAPRRPPPLALQQPAAPDCVATCAAMGSSVPLSEPAKAAAAFESCGMVVIPEVFAPAVLAELRDELVRRQNLTQGMPAGHKLEMPGVRGSSRQELVLPFRHAPALLAALGRPATLDVLTRLLGHPPAVDFASVIVAWPGADAQEFHRDADAGTEAALLLFVPLDPTSATAAGASGPPELCPCSHVPGSPEVCSVDDTGEPIPMATDDRAPLGSVVVYDPGLVHRGAVNPPKGGGGGGSGSAAINDPLFGDEGPTGSGGETEPRLMLSLAIAPHGAGLRGRPESFLGGAARAHIQRWRAAVLGADEAHPAYGCSAFADCESCLGAGRSPQLEGGEEGQGKPLPWRTGCAWCSAAVTGWGGDDAASSAGECVADVAARCSSADEHYGESGMNSPICPGADTDDDDDGDYEEL
jgi:hypothetical protein